ncbi:hypothetical protein BaRGS_00000197, partial [Batillaria attramentaria]
AVNNKATHTLRLRRPSGDRQDANKEQHPNLRPSSTGRRPAKAAGRQGLSSGAGSELPLLAMIGETSQSSAVITRLSSVTRKPGESRKLSNRCRVQELPRKTWTGAVGRQAASASPS